MVPSRKPQPVREYLILCRPADWSPAQWFFIEQEVDASPLPCSLVTKAETQMIGNDEDDVSTPRRHRTDSSFAFRTHLSSSELSNGTVIHGQQARRCSCCAGPEARDGRGRGRRLQANSKETTPRGRLRHYNADSSSGDTSDDEMYLRRNNPDQRRKRSYRPPYARPPEERPMEYYDARPLSPRRRESNSNGCYWQELQQPSTQQQQQGAFDTSWWANGSAPLSTMYVQQRHEPLLSPAPLRAIRTPCSEDHFAAWIDDVYCSQCGVVLPPPSVRLAQRGANTAKPTAGAWADLKNGSRTSVAQYVYGDGQRRQQDTHDSRGLTATASGFHNGSDASMPFLVPSSREPMFRCYCSQPASLCTCASQASLGVLVSPLRHTNGIAGW